jgi:hypothetical protein
MNPSRFFVRKLLLAEDSPVLEIQMLRKDNLPISVVSFPADTQCITIGDYIIPAAVIGAARRCELDSGDYVDASGATVRPF